MIIRSGFEEQDLINSKMWSMVFTLWLRRWSVTDQNGFAIEFDSSGKEIIWECIEWKPD